MPKRAARGPYSCSSSSQKDRGPQIIARNQLSHLSVWVDRLNKRGSSGNAKSDNCVITLTGPKSSTPRRATLAQGGLAASRHRRVIIAQSSEAPSPIIRRVPRLVCAPRVTRISRISWISRISRISRIGPVGARSVSRVEGTPARGDADGHICQSFVLDQLIEFRRLSGMQPHAAV